MALAIRDVFVTSAVELVAFFRCLRDQVGTYPRLRRHRHAVDLEERRKIGAALRHPRGRQGVTASTRMEE